MTIKQEHEGSKRIVFVDGYLDALTSPELETELEKVLPESTDLVIDFGGLEYISSAGLRVLLGSQKTMDAKGGKMTIRNVGELIMEVFEETGFTNILDIED